MNGSKRNAIRRGRPKFMVSSLFLLLSSTITPFVLAWAPPHPNHTNYESAVAYRRKNNITFTYSPSNLNVEVCKYLTEEECQHADQSMKIQHDTHQYNQRRLEANPDFDLNILVLLLQFSDHADRELPEPWQYQILLNLRVAEYLKVNSYGNYRVWFDVQPWMVTDNTEKHYAAGKSGRELEFQKSFHPLMDKLWDSGEIDNWNVYDNNNDGVLDNLMVLTSSYAAELGNKDCSNQRTDTDRIWSHALADVSRENWVSKDGQMQSNGYTIASALKNTCGSTSADVGVITHEFFHAIAGMPDLYDTETDDNGILVARGKGGTGSFDIMSNPYGIGQDYEDFPSHLSPFSKYFLGWIQPTVANEQGSVTQTYTLRPSESYDDNIMIRLEYFFQYEYLMIENRQRKLFDIKLFGTGLVIYHIDDGLSKQSSKGYPGQDGWPGNLKHYRVAVLPADGKYDLERLQNRGDAGDFWQPGMTLGPNDDGNTFPSTDTYGVTMGEYPSGVIVEVLEQNGDDIVIQVTIPDQIRMTPPKPGQEMYTPPKETAPDQISDRFQTEWFKEAKQEQAGTGVAERPVGVGTAERPQEQEVGEKPNEFVVVVPPEQNDNDNGETVTDGSEGAPGLLEDLPLFAANQKEADELNSSNGTVLPSESSINNTGTMSVGSIDNNDADSSVFTELFTNATNEEIDAEVESDGEAGKDIATAVPPSQVLAPMEEETIPPTWQEEDWSGTTIVSGSLLLWGVLPSLVLLFFG